MKRIFSILFIAFVCAAAFAQNNGGLPKIAVYVTGDQEAGANRALTTRLLEAFVNSNRYAAVERSDAFVSEIDREQGKQRSGAVDDEQISRLGRQSGVQFVCVANITQAFGSYQVSARIIDVETADVTAIGVADSRLETMEDLTAVSNDIVAAMFGGGQIARPVSALTTTSGKTVVVEVIPFDIVEHFMPKRLIKKWLTEELSEALVTNIVDKSDGIYSAPAPDAVESYKLQLQEQIKSYNIFTRPQDHIIKERHSRRIAADNGIHSLIIVSITRGGRPGKHFDARLIDTHSGEVTATATHSGRIRDSSDVQTVAKALAAKLLNQRKEHKPKRGTSFGIHAVPYSVSAEKINIGGNQEIASAFVVGFGLITSTRLSDVFSFNSGFDIISRNCPDGIFDTISVSLTEWSLTVPALIQWNTNRLGRERVGYLEFGLQADILLSSTQRIEEREMFVIEKDDWPWGTITTIEWGEWFESDKRIDRSPFSLWCVLSANSHITRNFAWGIELSYSIVGRGFVAIGFDLTYFVHRPN